MTARKSWLPAGGTNLFQEIKAQCIKAEEAGQKLFKLSIGQPQGPALLSARKAAAEAVKSGQETMHEYQDNGSPGVPDFAQRFVQAHVKRSLSEELEHKIDYLPTPGSKPMLGLVPLACGAATRKIDVGTTTSPGYPTPSDWCNYLALRHYPLLINVENGFRFNMDTIRKGTKLIMVNYPHNPTGQIGTVQWWNAVCDFCERYGIRLFNDAAYAILTHTEEACALADRATRFSNLSWAESFSASKVIGNGTGWRIGAMVGSADFIGDIKTIKGNTDSGFVAPMAAGVINAIENDKKGIEQCRVTYKQRIDLLIDILTSHGMKIAVQPKAGFFTLWLTPNKAFGQRIVNAQHFNYLMIKKTGVVGVHFDPYIRYAVCSDVKAMEEKINEAFEKAQVSYD